MSLIAVQRLGCPVPADLAEQTVLDGIPFGGAGRVMRNGDGESQAIAPLPLNLVLPGATPGAIAAAGIGQDRRRRRRMFRGKASSFRLCQR
jgi:hypothetical protein